MIEIKAAGARDGYKGRMRTMPFSPPTPLSLPTPPAVRRETAGAAAGATPLTGDARGWLTLAVGSLVIAGLLSLAVVVGRLPVLSRIIDDPLFFKRCLVVHVDLALVVWFYAFLTGLLALGVRAGAMARAGLGLAVAGVVAMLAGAPMRGAQPILANYVPIIDHPLFAAGLALFALGTLLTLLHLLAGPAGGGSPVPAGARVGLRAAAVLVAVAAATWVAARAGLPDGVDAYTRAEFLAWGPGHVLQAANTAAMLGVWLWLATLATGAEPVRPGVAALLAAALALPHAAMPLLTARGTLDALYHTGATWLMRWTLFPAVVAAGFLCFRHLRRRRADPAAATPEARLARTALAGSAGLAALGLLLGACIRSSTTLVPAHYHAALGAVTLAFMAAAYPVAAAVRRGPAATPDFWRAGRRQLALYGVGQAVFALGFALGGVYGLGRKAYAGEQHVRSAGELAGLVTMGLGGLVAVAGGLWFLALLLREIRGWWRAAPGPAAPAVFQHR